MINVLRFRFKIAKKVIYRLYIYFFLKYRFFLCFNFGRCLCFILLALTNEILIVQFSGLYSSTRTGKHELIFFSFHALIINYVFKRLFADIYILFCVAD